LVNTDDVEQFFSRESGRDLKPLFDLYIRSINQLQVHIKELPGNKYQVQLQNMSIPLPIDVTTDTGTKRMTIDSKGLLISSKTLPVIDEDTYYIKKVTIE
jgi:hypothetical protein